jgi:predicted small metal-binding protein
MTKTIRCDCGVTLRGDTDDELVRNVQTHAKDVHHMDITAEQALAMAEPTA